MTKICPVCKKELDIACFNKNCRSKDGLNSWCRDCQRAYFRAWQEKNHEKHKAHSRSYYHLHKAELKAYRQANRDRIITYQKAYREFNKEYLNTVRRLRRRRLQAKQTWQQLKTKAEINTQLRLLDA